MACTFDPADGADVTNRAASTLTACSLEQAAPLRRRPSTQPARRISAYRERIFRIEYFTGQIDEVRLWDRARTGAETRTDMELTPLAGNEPGLAGYSRFDEGRGTTARDQSGAFPRNGTIHTPPPMVLSLMAAK